MNSQEEDDEMDRMVRSIRRNLKKAYGNSLNDNLRPVVDAVHNEHYGEMELEPLDVAEAWLTDEQLKGAYLFQLIKYLGRYNMAKEGKGGLADLKKMSDYLGRLIELNQ